MRIINGLTDVPSAGTAVQLSSEGHKVVRIYLYAPAGNTNNVYFGDVNVVSGNGFILAAGQRPDPIVFDPGSVLLSNLYVDADTSGNDLSWIAVVQ
jgi:hypothetical protein